MSSSSGAYFDPATVSKIFGNLPTDLASQVINSMASLQAAVGMAARPFGHGYGVYDTALRATRDLADRDVSVRSWLAVSKWVDDAAPFPGEVFRRWVSDFCQRDMLIKGEVELRGQMVDLSNIECAVLNVSGKRDYVVPTSKTEATTALARSSDKESVTLDAGHVGMLVGPGPRIYGYASGTGLHPAVANLQPPDLSVAVAISTPAILSDDLRTVVRRPCNRRTSPCGWAPTPAGWGSRQISYPTSP